LTGTPASLLPEPSAVVPHRGDALLLDRIVAVDALHLAAILRVRPGTTFSDAAGALPRWVAPEIMAQAVAAYAGCHALQQRGRASELGLLLGVRDLTMSLDSLAPGEDVRVEVCCTSADEEGRGVFDCRLLVAGEVIAAATLTAFQPQDSEVLQRVLAAG
jgi:predicted hotdog family 3-hydroxylacyl-ACP dehydratase